MSHDDYAIAMAALDAIEQEARRARSVLRQEVLPEPCAAEVWSTDYYPAGHIDPYWIRCTKVGPHDQHQDSNTGLSWPDRPETPAQDAHTPRGATNTLPGGMESGEGGGGAQRVFHGGDDERRMWTWECTDCQPTAFGDEPTSGEASDALARHRAERHSTTPETCDPWNACPEHGDQHWRECLDRETALIAAQRDEARAQVARVWALADDIEAEEDERWSFRTASRIRDALDGATFKAAPDCSQAGSSNGEAAVRHG